MTCKPIDAKLHYAADARLARRLEPTQQVGSMKAVKAFARAVWHELAAAHPEVRKSAGPVIVTGETVSKSWGNGDELADKARAFGAAATTYAITNRNYSGIALWVRRYGTAQLVETVLHELAHALVNERRRHDGPCGHANCHGTDFVEAMRDVCTVVGIRAAYRESLREVGLVS